MDKRVCFIAFLISAIYDSSTSTNIECDFSLTDAYGKVGTIHLCIVNNNPNILTRESAWIDSINGTLAAEDEMTGFRAVDKTIKYFPKNLPEKIKMFWIQSCQLLEIHQADLKPYPNLVFFRLYKNSIEVIEEGLFDFNPNLVAVGLHESNIIHIDAGVFDRLNKMDNLWLIYAPCVNQDVVNSRERVELLIKLVKNQCTSSDFSSMEKKILNLEDQTRSLEIGTFDRNVEEFEQEFKISKFHKFRPLNYKFEKVAGCSICHQGRRIVELDEKIQSLRDRMKVLGVYGLRKNLEDSQCGLKDFKTDQQATKNKLEEIKGLQIEQSTAIKSSIAKSDSKLDKLQSSLDQLSISQSSTANSITDLNSSILHLKSTQESIKLILNSLKSSQDTTQSSISDIVASVSDLKKNQVEFKQTLVKIKNLQNDAKVALNDLSFKDAGSAVDEKMEKFEARIEEHLMNFEDRTAEKIAKELASMRHKMSMNLDEKVKDIEKRLAKKFEEVLEKKLVKIVEQKIRND
ncbi:unnamed protein product [Chironomus riparius]|uniref:Uncharacterized protein n=1 Tax=Chironomus riparius TaxID=315576 RepID=A0A9N9S7R6_9DIPT|nr:unnamed protein product [Chironomus riparius]